jgi:quercetin dioxygenase-like cupin family protein
LTTTPHESKHAATKHLLAEGFAFARTAKPPHWYHSDGRQAVVVAAGSGRYVVEYRDAEPLVTRIWVRRGVWQWSVRRANADAAVAEGSAASETEAYALMQAVVSAARMHAAKGRAARKKRRRKTIVRTR